MPITFACGCGQPLFVADKYAGMAVECPTCGKTPTAPYLLPPSSAPAPIPTAKPWKKGAAAEEPEPAPMHDPNSPFGFSDPGEVARERNRKAQEREHPTEKSQSLEGGLLNGGVAGGAIAMLIAVVWFVVGLMADVIFFYPPVLFIIGLVSFFKGLAEGPKER
ncbi:MAG: hypothetical protein K8U57_32560 [Planctomycetes bacterium]|nr:hypothetical protein [Planctomycetota bacterium]